MIDSGALAVMGNHEFNALRYDATKDSTLSGGLRRTLEEFATTEEEWTEYLGWFRSLPLFLELGALRIVHAVWDDRHIATARRSQSRDSAFWANALNPESEVGRAINIILNGWQVTLPGQTHVEEFEGSTRSFMRVAWWLNEGPMTFRRASLPFDPSLPDIEISNEVAGQLPGYGEAEPPVFIGHYALPPDLTPWPQKDNIACVDYRAAKRGPLVGYRWDGEPKLIPSKFVSSAD